MVIIMYVMSEKTKTNIEKSIGMSIDEFSKLSADEEKVWIEQKINKPIKFTKSKRSWVIGRGNPLIARRKIRSLSDLESKSRKLFGI